jgi:hypothetical protein
MQTEKIESPELASAESAPSTESLYRTRWLMAHNRLHTIAHNSSASASDTWNLYLKDLSQAEEIAKTPA